MNKTWLRSIKSKGKVKCTLVQALRLCTGRTTHRGSRGIALLFLDHGTRRGEGSASRPGRSLPPEKTQYPLYRRLGGVPGPVWTGAENLAPTGIRSPDRQARSQSLYRLRYPAHSIKSDAVSYIGLSLQTSREHIAVNASGSGYNHPVTPRSTDLIQKPTAN